MTDQQINQGISTKKVTLWQKRNVANAKFQLVQRFSKTKKFIFTHLYFATKKNFVQIFAKFSDFIYFLKYFWK